MQVPVIEVQREREGIEFPSQVEERAALGG